MKIIPFSTSCWKLTEAVHWVTLFSSDLTNTLRQQNILGRRRVRKTPPPSSLHLVNSSFTSVHLKQGTEANSFLMSPPTRQHTRTLWSSTKSRPIYVEITDMAENWIDDQIATISLLRSSPPRETAKITLKKVWMSFRKEKRSTGGELLQTGH